MDPAEVAYCDFARDIIHDGDKKAQLAFLQVYRAFRSRTRLYDIWLREYTEVCDQYQRSKRLINTSTIRITPLKSSKISTNTPHPFEKKKTAITQFLSEGLKQNLLDCTRPDIDSLLPVLVQHGESSELVSTVKLAFIRFNISVDAGRKSLSVRNIAEVVKKTVIPAPNTSRDLTPPADVMEIQPRDFAAYLSAVFSERASPHEIIHMALTDATDPVTTPVLRRIVDKFTQLSYLIPTEILLCRKTTRNRRKFLKYVLNVLRECYAAGNFQAVFAIVAGVTMNPVQRLRSLWYDDDTPTKTRLAFEEIEEIVTPVRSYAKYRTELAKRDRAIPYTGLITSDIKHLVDSGLYLPSMNTPNSLVVNPHAYNTLVQLVATTPTTPPTVPDPMIAKWFVVYRVTTDDDALYKLSCAIQPPNRAPTLDLSTVVSTNPPSLFTPHAAMITPMRRLERHNSLTFEKRGVSVRLTRSVSFHRVSTRDDIQTILKNCVELWSEKMVAKWLREIGLAEYADKFISEAITGATLLLITDDQFKNDLGVSKLGHRIRLRSAIAGLGSLRRP